MVRAFPLVITLVCGAYSAYRCLGSTWHVIEYNSTTGAVIKKRTAQGYSDSRSGALALIQTLELTMSLPTTAPGRAAKLGVSTDSQTVNFIHAVLEKSN
jgi:hypothetical protein